ncbi:MAG: GNAT family N-acetyltransferase [Desulfitobacteriaceae bacterium]|nr:GNAT family N-acetyltransferase [Clostridia bacterium]MDD4400649.1 GNAT family N-acetyltransferase [Desulfitobacteriaceae bacterium]
MLELRLAQKGETDRQKFLWSLCFGDSSNFIDFYYANRYREDETALLLLDGEILAMLTMLPVRLEAAGRSYDSVMLYAIATHPEYRNMGYAGLLIDFAHRYLHKNGIVYTFLVPAGKQLFKFYQRMGYRKGFYIREAILTGEKIDSWNIVETCGRIISAVSAEEYNLRRNNLLGVKPYVSYNNLDITYQKKLSQISGADIYGLEFREVYGCAVAERINPDKVIIKELLVNDEYIATAVKKISCLLPAKEYILRLPVFLGRQLESTICPLGMIRANDEIEPEIVLKDDGYLGLAFD